MKDKRIKLTDEELAIGMWVYIYLKIYEVEGNTGGNRISGWKFEYLKAHNLGRYYWYNGCLLCQRYINEHGACECPLNVDGDSCGEGSIYDRVLQYHSGGQYRKNALWACKEIIKVMLKEEDNGVYEE